MKDERIKIEGLNGVYTNTSVSHGTLRTSDLFGVFSDLLDGTDEWMVLTETNPEVSIGAMLCGMQSYDNEWWDTSDACEALEMLEDALDGHAPEGYYFGSHPGDGSDFGFWESER